MEAVSAPMVFTRLTRARSRRVKKLKRPRRRPFMQGRRSGVRRRFGTILGIINDAQGLSDLAGNPFRCRAGGDVGPDQTASLKMDDCQTIEQLEADGTYNEQ